MFLLDSLKPWFVSETKKERTNYYMDMVKIMVKEGRMEQANKLTFIKMPTIIKNYIVGYLDGYDSRVKAGYPPDTGPDVIVSPFCIMRFDPVTKEAYLDALHPNITIDQVKENTGWDLKVADNVKQITPPTLKEIEVCRQKMQDAIDQYFVLKPEWTIYLEK